MSGISIKLRVVTEYAGRSGARRIARRMARVFGSTHARRTACVDFGGRRARPQRLVPEVFAMLFELALAGDLMIVVSWRPIPLRHAEACAAGRCGPLPGFNWPVSQNLSSIGSRTVEIALMFSDIDFGPYRNGRRYLAPVNDYRQRSAALPS
ncbi:hypothetical protein EVAR_78916_1 [Eumeta japonica]|uniref:Uncharacterized protein n=1 Tax=Eumeta variegata TaxID=151549 RepID=A0A4C1U350_EUMVA|nr:hypothetical protein EVAR_78916_1 [Eumeta japonica]